MPIAAGLVVSGASAYLFLIVAAHVLTVEQYATFGVAWTMIFVAATGLFLPIEQEVIRAISLRRGGGRDWRVVLRRAWILSLAFAGAAAIAGFAMGGLLVSRLLGGDWVVYAGFLTSLFGYAFGYMVRGVLAGTEDFSRYGFYVGWDGLLRAGLGVGAAIIGLRTAGALGMVVGLSSVLAPLSVIASKRASFKPIEAGTDEAGWSQLTASLGALLVASLASQFLANAGPLALQLIVGNEESNLVGVLFAALVMARIPLFMFQSVQAALLPRLARQAEGGRFAEFRKAVSVVAGWLGVATLVGAVTGAVVGPFAIRLIFGSRFRLGSLDLGLLLLMVGLHLETLTLSQGLVALKAQVRMAITWVVGLFVAVLMLMTSLEPLHRVVVALVVGEAAAACCGTILLRMSIARACRAE